MPNQTHLAKTSPCSHVWELSSNRRHQIGYSCARCDAFTRVDDLEEFQSTLEPEIGEAELAEFIRDVEQGHIELYPRQTPSKSVEGCVEYQTSNGWSVVVFNDCGNWDYFDKFESSDGRLVTLTTMPPAIQLYRPDPVIAAQRYGFVPPVLRGSASA